MTSDVDSLVVGVHKREDGADEAAVTLWRRSRSTTRPLVSVCIPAFNHSEYVEAAVRSALAQTYEPLEVIVVDDCSDDGGYERLLAIDDKRLHLARNARRVGHAANRNHVIGLARGELIKFLDDDDILEPDCVAEMVGVFARDERVGMVFSPRRILVEGTDRGEPPAGIAEWLAVHGAPHGRFDKLGAVNDGRSLFRQWLDDGFRTNWIGEPTVLMISREHLRRAGGFSLHVQQLLDVDLWARILPHSLVGFIDKQLAGYRTGHLAATTLNNRTQRAWLDRLWLLEGLAEDFELSQAYPEILELLVAERRQAWRTTAKLGRGADGLRVPPGRYFAYGWYRLRSLAGLPSSACPEWSDVAVDCG